MEEFTKMTDKKHEIDRELFKTELEFLDGDMAWRPTVNQHPLVRSGFHCPDRVIICDQTLREGEETPGVCLSLGDRLEIARKLEEVEIPEIEVGYVGAIPEHAQFSRELKKEGTKLKLVSHTRTYTKSDEWKKELDMAVEAGSDILCLLSHGSNTLAETTPWLPLEAIPERVAEAIKYTKALGVISALALVDGVRTPLQNFIDIYKVAAKAGVKRVYVMDGQGVALPETAYFLVRLLRGIVGKDVEVAVHFHDDYGLATANTLAGIKAGAEVADTVVAGLGDKAGIGATEEVIMSLENLYDVRTGVNTKLLYELAETVSRVFKIKLAPNKAIVGSNIVRHQIDSHLNTLLRGYWWAWESIKPEFFGRQRTLEWAKGKLRTGGRSGSIDAKIKNMGLEVTEHEWNLIVKDIIKMVEYHETIYENQLEDIIINILKGRGK